MQKISAANYPLATVACFDATCGSLPRRQLDVENNNRFLENLAAAGAGSLLIGASTGQGHLRTVEELDTWFRSTNEARLGNAIKIALLRPEDGEAANRGLVETLVESDFQVAFVRPGNNLPPDATDSDVAANMLPVVKSISDANMAVGVYSIPDVSGIPLRPAAVVELLDQLGDRLVAIKVTEANYENSTRRFLECERLESLKIVQGWDPFLADALRDSPARCGVTSGPMSFAIHQYRHILDSAAVEDWNEVTLAQAAVTDLFVSMQDDPGKFADLQRAKMIMGLGHPISAEITSDAVEKVFSALEAVRRDADRRRLAKSLNLMDAGPFSERLQQWI